MQPMQGKNWFLLACAPPALGYYMQPYGAKKTNPGTHLPEDPKKTAEIVSTLVYFVQECEED